MPFDGNSATFDLDSLHLPAARQALAAAVGAFRRPHAYLLATPDRMAAIRPIAAESAALGKRVRRALDETDEAAAGETTAADARAQVKREARRLICLAFAALVFDDDRRERASARAARELARICARDSWNPRPVIRSFLDRAETAIAVALAYDWLHDALGSDLRAAIEAALRRHILLPALDAYRDPAVAWPRRRDNLAFVSNAGCVIAALALLPRDRELCAEVLDLSLASLWQAFAAFAPAGAWCEGPSYWALAARHAGLAVAALESSFGTSFGLAARPGFAATGDFALHAIAPSGAAFDFGDSMPACDRAALAWFAHRFGRPTDGWLVKDYDGWHLPLALLWADRPALDPAAAAVPAGKVFRGHDLACFRTGWAAAPEARPVFVAIKGGNIAADATAGDATAALAVHSQADAGSFIIEGARTRWITDLGPDDYDLPGYFEHRVGTRPGRRWRYYRTSTRGHNTLVIDGRNQRHDAPAPIVGSHVGDGVKWVVFDLSAVYGAPPETIRRGAALLGRHVLIQDEIAPGFAGSALWVAHTRAEPVLLGERIGHFRCGPDRLVVRVLDGAARLRLALPPRPRRFRPDPAAPLHSHAGTAPAGGFVREKDHGADAGRDAVGGRLRRIEIAWPAGRERLAVLFSPEPDGDPVALRLAPLAQWLAGDWPAPAETLVAAEVAS